jgi:hypothetical protein
MVVREVWTQACTLLGRRERGRYGAPHGATGRRGSQTISPPKMLGVISEEMDLESQDMAAAADPADFAAVVHSVAEKLWQESWMGGSIVGCL